MNEAGYDCGMPDGIAGKNTQQAISRYRADKGLEGTGAIDDELLDALGVSGEKPEAGEESPAAPEGDEQGRELLDSIPMGGGVKGSFDEPAPTNPEERYEIFFDESDGREEGGFAAFDFSFGEEEQPGFLFEGTDASEEGLYMVLDVLNDESRDIEKHGAFYMKVHQQKPPMTVQMAMQNTPYGKAIIYKYQVLWMKTYMYHVDHYYFVYEGETVETEYYAEDVQGYCESFHFPYSSLERLRGVREDENGYTYFFSRVTTLTV